LKDPDKSLSLYLRRPRCDAQIAALFILLMSAAGCSTQHAAEDQKPAPAAKVENPVKEGELATVKLTPEAEARLGIRTAPVEFTSVTQTRTYGGEVVLPPDSAIIVSAPVAGTILAATNAAPVAGQMVRKGQQIFRLLPLLPPERNMRTQAEKELADAETRVESAKIKLARAEQLLRDKAGSLRQLEQAREEQELAETALKAAREKMERINRSPLEADTSVAIISPDDGMVQKVHVGTGQKVAGSTALFEIASLYSVWVRVPVYAGELGSIDQRQAAQVHNLGEQPGSPILSARPIAAPPSANPNAATVDLYFQLPNANVFRPGQKVGVTLTLRSAAESLVVPNSAIVRDIHGGEWVYEKTAPGQYTRRRVEVRHVTGSQAVLARGPAQGAQVVVEGAAEIFATEFSTGK
jgi:membrane fusion protein, heavy metal efflux system